MKASQIYRSLFSLLLVLAVLVSCIGTAFATEGETATAQPATKGIAFKSGSGEMIIADWVHDYTIVERGAEKMMADYAKAGITDVYLLVKGTAGKIGWTSSVSGTVQASNGDVLKSACTAAKKYGIRVHAWLMAGHDDNYLNKIDSSAMAYHFRVGYGTDVNQRINLRDKGYRDYTAKLVKELVTNYDIAGIHLDCIRYFELYYDWGQNARDELLTNYGITIDQYNAATKAMCKRGGYSYTMKTGSTAGYNNGASYSYVAYAASGTSASGNTTFSTVLGNSSYGDAHKGAKAFMELRTDTVAGFVETVKEAAGDGIIISCAIMPEPIEETFSKCLYGQDVAKLGKVCDYITPMAYATQYQKTASWPAALSEKCAAAGANVVTGVQAFNETYVSYASDLNAEIPQILAKAETVNANTAYGDILGYAFFRGATMTIGNSKFDESNSTLDLYLSNQTASADTKLVLKLQNGMTVDTSKLTNGMDNKTGFASGASFSVSSDKKTITITNGGSGVLSALSAATLTVAVKGTPSTTYGAVQLTSYKGSSYTEGKSFCVAAAIDVGVYNGITKGTCSGAHTDIETWTDGDGNHFAFCYNCLTDLTEACIVETTETDGYTSFVCVGGKNPTTGVTDVDAHSENGGCGYSYIASDSLNLHFNLGDIANETADWNSKAPHSMTGTVDTTKGILYGEITGGDPYIATDLSADEMHYNISGDDIIEVRIKTDITSGSGKGLQVFFTTSAHNGYDEAYSINKANVEHATGKYEVIQLPFNATKEYVGQTLTGLRVDPLGTGGATEIAATYEIDYIYIGPKSGAPSEQSDNELYFGFENDAAALSRYNGIVYGGRNFDQATEGYWATANNGNAKNFSIDNEAGTLNVSVGATADANGNYGPLVETTAKYNCYPWAGENHYAYYPLSFDPSNSNYVQVRFKLNGCEEVSGKNAQVSVIWDYTTDGTYGVSGDKYARIDMDAEGFQTVTIPVSDAIKQADEVKSLALRFQNIMSSSDGTVIIDYIYVGAKDSLYFGFENSEEDQIRYSGKTYGDNNFDTGNWVGRTSSVTDVSFNNEEGTLSFSSKDASQSYHYVQTATDGHTTDTPLNYVPSAGDYMQICFKIEDAAVNGEACIKVNYMTDDRTSIANDAVTDFALDASYLDGNYHLVNLPLGESFTKAGTVSALRVGFDGISSAEGKTAKFTLDYIYVGTKEAMPRQDKLFFDFTGDAAAEARYSAQTYGNTDFDKKDNWGRLNLSDFAVADGFLTGNITKESFIRTATGASMQVADCPLQYQPGANDCLQVRFKIEESTAETVNLKLYYYAQKNGDWKGITSVPYDITSGYILATIPLADTGFVTPEIISGIQVAFNGVTDGKLTVDYIYVGSERDLPADDELFFDFTNTTADQERYNSKNYGGVNYDDATTVQWKSYTTNLVAATTVVDNKAGTLTATSAQDGITSLYVDTTMNLSYVLSGAETIQIRMKMDNFVLDGSKTPYVTVHFFAEGSSGAVAKTETVELTAEQITADEYMILSIPLTDEIRAAGEINRLRVYVGNVSGDSSSVVTIDSIFVGKESNRPIHDHLFFDFTNAEEDRSRYASKTYGNVNFDIGNWKSNALRNEAPIYNNAAGTMTTNVVGVSPYLQTVGTSSSLGSAPLTFVPDENTDLVQIRLKLTNLQLVVEGATGQIVVHFMTEEGGEVETAPSLRYALKDSDLNGEYFTVNLNAKDFLSEIPGIYAIRVNAVNLLPADEGSGAMTIDYIYVGSRNNAPSGQVYFVDFMANDSGIVAQHTIVAPGEKAEYTGATPEMESDETYHYSFAGWKDESGNAVDLNNLTVSADIKLYPIYNAQKHSLRYTMIVDEAGETVEFHSCANCEFNIASGHVWDEGTITTAPTCTENGLMTYGCTMCSVTKTEEIVVSGHEVVVDAAVAATCTESGLTEGSHCSVCGEVFAAQEVVPASGHALEFHAEKAAGCTEDGYMEHYECTVCHKYFLDASGTIEVPESYLKSPALGHNFINGTCACGATETVEPVYVAELAMKSVNIDLASAIAINFNGLASIFDQYTDVYAVYSAEGKEDVIVRDYFESSSGTDLRYNYSYEGLTALDLGLNVNVTVYGTNANGELCYGATKNYSVLKYCTNAMNKGGKDAAPCANLLLYGNAAQALKGVSEAERVLSKLTEDQTALLNQYAYADDALNVAKTSKASNGTQIKFVSQNVDMLSRITMIYIMDFANYTGNMDAVTFKIKYTDVNGNAAVKEYTAADIVPNAKNANRYELHFAEFYSTQMREMATCEIYINGVLHGSYANSLENYCYTTVNGNNTEAMKYLATRMSLYGDAACAAYTAK